MASICIGIYSLYKPTVNEVIALTLFGGFLGAFLGALGISAMDVKSYWSNKNKDYIPINNTQDSNLNLQKQDCPCKEYPNCICGKNGSI
jgi:hypothetical protein